MDCVRSFDHTVDRYGEAVAVTTVGGDRRTFAELDARSNALANRLNDELDEARCAALLENGPAAIESMLASQKRGRGLVQLFTRGTVDELTSMMTTADAAGLIYDRYNAENAKEIVDSLDLDLVLAVGDAEGPDYEEAVRGSREARPVSTGDEAAVFYTSGTTSTPKAVPFDSEKLWLGSIQATVEMATDTDDVGLEVTPWYHMSTYTTLMLPFLHAGAELVTQARFEPHETLQAIETYGVTTTFAVPTQLRRMIDAQREEGYDLDTLDLVRTGGAIVKRDLIDDVESVLGAGVGVLYGMTEGGANATFSRPSEQADHPGTVGKASRMWELRVVEPAGPEAMPDPTAEVEAPGSGEVILRGPAMCEGYLDNPSETADLLVPDADGEWIRSGDIARLDADRFLYIIDRIDNMIISGGENIYPQEVERVLSTHDAVRDVAVLGLPDEEWGERVAAVVSGDVDGEELETWCRANESLADFKRPREYALTDEALPRTATGTLQREAIRRQFFGDA